MSGLRLRWPAVILSFAATLALLFGGSHLLRRRLLDEPLGAALAGLPAVQAHQVEREGGRRVIEVTLKDVPSLADAYRAVDGAARRLLGEGRYSIAVRDNRSPELAAIYHRMHFSLQEALATGRFAAMAEQVDALARRSGLERHRVEVDRDHVYVQLHKGGHYLYEVLDRPPVTRGGEPPS